MTEEQMKLIEEFLEDADMDTASTIPNFIGPLTSMAVKAMFIECRGKKSRMTPAEYKKRFGRELNVDDI